MAGLEDHLVDPRTKRLSPARVDSFRRMRWIPWVILAGVELTSGGCRDIRAAEARRGLGHSSADDIARRERQLQQLRGSAHLATTAGTPAHHDAAMGGHAVAYEDRRHVGSFAWTDEEWRHRCAGVRTSYNPDHDLSDETLTLRPNDPRWLDFVFWSMNNKVNEHQFEALGGTGWRGPTSGVLFHWAPGSHWERDSLHSFGFVIGHIVGEHRWTDTMFPDFFEKYGGVYGINVKDRLVELGPRSKAPWVAFLDTSEGREVPTSVTFCTSTRRSTSASTESL